MTQSSAKTVHTVHENIHTVRELQSNHIICPNRFPDHLQQVILKTFAVLIS